MCRLHTLLKRTVNFVSDKNQFGRIYVEIDCDTVFKLILLYCTLRSSHTEQSKLKKNSSFVCTKLIPRFCSLKNFADSLIFFNWYSWTTFQFIISLLFIYLCCFLSVEEEKKLIANYYYYTRRKKTTKNRKNIKRKKMYMYEALYNTRNNRHI